MTVSVKVSTDISNTEAQLRRAREELKRVSDQLKSMGKDAKDFGKIDFSQVGGQDADKHLAKIQQQYKELLNLNSDLRRRIRVSGQENSSPFDLDWARLGFLNPRTQDIQRQNFLRNIMAGTPWQPPLTSPQDPGAHGEPQNRGGSSGGGGLSTSMIGGLRMGLGFLGINAGLGALGQAFTLGKSLATDTDLFIRRTREAGESFASTRTRLEQLGKDLAITDTEAAKLGIAFATTANITDQAQAAEGTRNAIGFGRGYGIDPATAVHGFGQLQLLGAASGNGMSQRQMMLLIGKTISDGMLGGKAEQVISELGTHVERFVAQNMRAPGDVADYLGLRAAMGQLANDPNRNLPGLASHGGALYEQMTQGLRGNAGGLGSEMIRGRVLQQAGYDPWEIYNLQQRLTPLTRLKNGNTYYESFMSYAQQQFGGQLNDPKDRERILAMLSATTGQSAESLYAWDQAYQQYKTGQSNAGKNALDWDTELQRAGVSSDKLNPSGIKEIGDIFGAGDDLQRLKEIGARYLQRPDLPTKDKGDLASAIKEGGAADLRSALLRVAGTLGMTQTEGSKLQQTMADLINTLTEVIGTKLVGAITELVDTIKPVSGWLKSIAEFLGIKSESANIGEKESIPTGKNAPILSAERWKWELNPKNWGTWETPNWAKKLNGWMNRNDPNAQMNRQQTAEAMLAKIEQDPSLFGNTPEKIARAKAEQQAIIDEEKAKAAPAKETQNPSLRGNLQSQTQNDAASVMLGAIAAPETGTLAELDDPSRFIRTRETPDKNKGRSSSAYGPVQLTKTYLQDFKKRQGSNLNPAEQDYLDRLIQQGQQFLSADRQGALHDPIYGYGGRGQLGDTAQQRALYLSIAKKSLVNLAQQAPNYATFIRRFRGEDDQRYFNLIRKQSGKSPEELFQELKTMDIRSMGNEPPSKREHVHTPLQSKPRDNDYTPLPADAPPPAAAAEKGPTASLDIYLHQRDAAGRPTSAPLEHRMGLSTQNKRGSIHVDELYA